MCGIAGFVDYGSQLKHPKRTMKQMISTLGHRGPDDEGVWYDEGVGLGHTRLSILDLSPEGHQPMLSNSGRYVITYNGEVYNHNELRSQLEKQGKRFRGHSDTEVIISAIDSWGLEKSVNRFIGMFAFALWDRKTRLLHLVRDRMGIKPLYYGIVNGSFVYASELKAIRAFTGFQQLVNRDAITLFLRHSYIPAPHTIYHGIQKLLPAHILTLDMSEGVTHDYKISAYWSVTNIVESGVNEKFAGTPQDAVEQLDELLRDAIGLRMAADVPLGAFLSGGIDSSTVVALMQAQSEQPVRTFSIGSEEPDYNSEAVYAKAISQHLGTNHTELYVHSSDVMDVIPKLPMLYDEPFADSSQIPTFLISKLTRNYVTVSLSGDGGDELFFGYTRYFTAQRIWQKIGWIPENIRGLIRHVLMSSMRTKNTKLKLLAEILNAETADDLYYWLVSNWKQPSAAVIDGSEPLSVFTDISRQAQLSNINQRMIFYDLVSYLPDDILVKLDRASMGVNLEARVPLLDHRVVEFAWRLPFNYKVRGGQGKWILRQVLYKYVPPELFERPKQGFGVPIGIWLRGPLRDWAEALLNEHRLRHEGYLNSEPILKAWRDFLEIKGGAHYNIWNILMFQSWLETEKNMSNNCHSERRLAN